MYRGGVKVPCWCLLPTPIRGGRRHRFELAYPKRALQRCDGVGRGRDRAPTQPPPTHVAAGRYFPLMLVDLGGRIVRTPPPPNPVARSDMATQRRWWLQSAMTIALCGAQRSDGHRLGDQSQTSEPVPRRGGWKQPSARTRRSSGGSRRGGRAGPASRRLANLCPLSGSGAVSRRLDGDGGSGRIGTGSVPGSVPVSGGRRVVGQRQPQEHGGERRAIRS